MTKQSLVRLRCAWSRPELRWLALIVTLFCARQPALCRGDEPLSSSTSLNFDAHGPEIFDTPFGKTRGTRAPAGTIQSPFSSITESAANSEADSESGESPSARRGTDAVPLTKSPGRKPPGHRVDGATHDDIAATRSTWNSVAVWFVLVFAAIGLGIRWLGARCAKAARILPNDVLEVLGRVIVDPRTSVLLVRCGSRLLLLGSSATGLRTLSEITDPVEADCLAGLCRSTERDHALLETFRLMLKQPSGSRTAPEPEPARPPVATTEPNWTNRLTPRLPATANLETRP